MTDHTNQIVLLGLYGGDETHALSAWTSTSRDLDVPDHRGVTKRERIPNMLKFLAKGSDGMAHETPFEKSSLHFLVTGEIASHIHLLKHRIGVSINTESARYKELTEDKFYLPTDWQEEEKAELEAFCEIAFEKYHAMLKKLMDRGVSKKRAKESARFFLPYATQLVFDVMFNFRSFVHFQKLRHKPGAQTEIHDIADEMLRLVREDGRFNHSLDAFDL